MFQQAAMTQARVIGALVLRETRVRYGRTQFGYFWALVEPISYVAILSTIFSFSGNEPPFGDSQSLFFALGVIPYFLFRNLAQQLGGAFEANEALLSFPIVQQLDTVFARAILEIATMLLISAILFTAITLIEETALPNDPFKIMIASAELALLGIGIGLCNAVINIKLKAWRNIFQLIMTPMFLLSGIFFSLETLPAAARDILIWNPILHGVEGVRSGYFMNYRGSAIDLTYLLWWGLILLLVGLAAERFVRIRSK